MKIDKFMLVKLYFGKNSHNIQIFYSDKVSSKRNIYTQVYIKSIIYSSVLLNIFLMAEWKGQ